MGTGKIRNLAFARRGRLSALLIVLCAGLVSCILIGKQTWLAGWGLIDDHEIFYFLGNQQQHLPFSEIVSTLLNKTEVGSLDGRFRPAYYFLRVLETWAWGRNVHLWYGFSTVAFAFFLGSVWWVIYRFIGLLPSALCMMPVVSASFWGAVWGRLGPAEIYATPATGLMVLGYYEIFFASSIWRRNLGCVALTLGTLIVIGTKETLLPLAFLTLFIVGLAVATRRLTLLFGLISAAVTLVFFSFVAWLVLRQLAHSGADIYGNTVSPIARIKTTLTSMRLFSAGFIVIAMLSIAFIAGLVLGSRKLLSIPESVGGLGILSFLLGFFISQQISYSGSLPTGTRYDFPAMLIPVCFVIFIGCVVSLRLREAGNERLADAFSLCFAVALVLGLWPTGGIKGAIASIDQVEANITKTKEFSEELAAILSRAGTDSAVPVILEAYGPGAYEPVFSMQRYLLSAGLRNPIAIRLHPDQISNGPLYDHLERALRDLQDNGGSSFAKLASLPGGAPCLSIGINGEANMHCWGFRIRT